MADPVRSPSSIPAGVRQMVVPICSGCGQPAEEACGGAHLDQVATVVVADLPMLYAYWASAYSRSLATALCASLHPVPRHPDACDLCVGLVEEAAAALGLEDRT